MNLVTEQFTALSRRVIQLIGQLRENQVESVAAVLEKLQAVEKEKLEMVCCVEKGGLWSYRGC